MKTFNLSRWALEHKSFVVYLMLIVALAGIFEYRRLGRDEDPPFTIKTMVVKTLWPGATTLETMRQITDRIEKKLEELPNLDYVRSYTKPGESVVFVYLKDSTRAVGRARSLVPGAKEGRRHQTHLATRRAGSLLQRRVRRYLCADLRADFGWLLPPRAARLCRARASRTAQRSRRCEDRPSRHPGRENLSGILDPPARRHGARHFRADTDLAGAKRDPAERDGRLGCREDRDPRLGSVHVRREPESHQFPFQWAVLSAERHCQGATRLR